MTRRAFFTLIGVTVAPPRVVAGQTYSFRARVLDYGEGKDIEQVELWQTYPESQAGAAFLVSGDRDLAIMQWIKAHQGQEIVGVLS